MVIEAIKDFIGTCPYLDQFTPINIDYLSKDAVNYSIGVTPAQPILKNYVDGSTLRQVVFIFASREVYGSDEMLNIQNSGFYENFSHWIEEQNKNSKLPQFKSGESKSIEVLTPGYVFQTDVDRGQYQIQLRLIYYKK